MKFISIVLTMTLTTTLSLAQQQTQPHPISPPTQPSPAQIEQAKKQMYQMACLAESDLSDTANQGLAELLLKNTQAQDFRQQLQNFVAEPYQRITEIEDKYKEMQDQLKTAFLKQYGTHQGFIDAAQKLVDESDSQPAITLEDAKDIIANNAATQQVVEVNQGQTHIDMISKYASNTCSTFGVLKDKMETDGCKTNDGQDADLSRAIEFCNNIKEEVEEYTVATKALEANIQIVTARVQEQVEAFIATLSEAGETILAPHREKSQIAGQRLFKKIQDGNSDSPVATKPKN